MKVGVLHPGDMGVSVARALVAAGHEACWAVDGRSPATASRAEPFTAFPDLDELTRSVEAIVSVCPPHAAVAQAQAVMQAGFDGTYVDANAVSPESATQIAGIVGANYVDGGIVGPPADRPGTTRLYLSGPHAESVAGWFTGSLLDARAIGTDVSSASALKMAYAAYTKGSAALLLAVNALAERNGVADALRAEWEISQPGLVERSTGTARGTSGKAWRFVGEMEEIAATFAAAGLPDGFHKAAADLYARMRDLKDLPPADLEAVVSALLTGGEQPDR